MKRCSRNAVNNVDMSSLSVNLMARTQTNAKKTQTHVGHKDAIDMQIFFVFFVFLLFYFFFIRIVYVKY